jgi:opacity protein-like surface antigen
MARRLHLCVAAARSESPPQQPTLSDEAVMKHLLVGAAMMAAVAAPLAAQTAGEPVTSGHGSLFAGPYAGYMHFGEYNQFQDGSKLSYENGLFFGGQLGWSFNPNITVLGNLGYSKSKQVLKEEGNGTGNDLRSPTTSACSCTTRTCSSRLPIDLGSGSSSFAPFVQGGIGQAKYTADYNDLGSKGTTNTTFNVGRGRGPAAHAVRRPAADGEGLHHVRELERHLDDEPSTTT